MPLRQVAQPHPPDAHALEPGNAQAHQFAHAPDLPLAPLLEHKAELLRVGPGHLGRTQCLAIQIKAMIEQGQAARIEHAIDSHEVFFLDLRIVADQLARHPPILGQDEQTRGIDVQPPGRRQPTEVRRLQALKISRRLGLRRDEDNGRLMPVFGLPET